MELLRKQLDMMLDIEKMPEEWRNSGLGLRTGVMARVVATTEG